MSYVVTAPLCLVHTPANLLYLYNGSPVPADTEPADITRLLAFGMIEEVVEPEPETIPETPETPVSDANLAELDYPSLQALAKEKGIAANQTKDELIAALSAN